MSETQISPVALFERLGGSDAIERLVEVFYHRMDVLPQARKIRAMHDRDLGATKQALKDYLSEWTGGPKLYTPQKGHPRLRQRHLRIPIDIAERDAWMLCMHGALEETIVDVGARREIDEALTKLADWLRNQAGNPHDTRGHL